MPGRHPDELGLVPGPDGLVAVGDEQVGGPCLDLAVRTLDPDVTTEGRDEGAVGGERAVAVEARPAPPLTRRRVLHPLAVLVAVREPPVGPDAHAVGPLGRVVVDPAVDAPAAADGSAQDDADEEGDDRQGGEHREGELGGVGGLARGAHRAPFGTATHSRVPSMSSSSASTRITPSGEVSAPARMTPLVVTTISPVRVSKAR